MMSRRDAALTRLIVIVLGALLAPASADAAAWNRDKGDFFVLSRIDYFRATGNFLASTPDGESDRFERFETNTYTEYGLNDRVTLGGKLVYGTTTISNQFESVTLNGFSEIEGFVQTKLWRNNQSAASLRFSGAAPSRIEPGTPGIVTDGAAAEIRALYGRNLSIEPKVYVNFEVAYRRRFGPPADETRFDATIGYEPVPRLLLLLQSFNTIALRNEEPGGTDFDVYRIQPSLVWRASRRWSVQVGAIHDYAGRNFARGNTVFIGLGTSF